jgi:hypothetical protein
LPLSFTHFRPKSSRLLQLQIQQGAPSLGIRGAAAGDLSARRHVSSDGFSPWRPRGAPGPVGVRHRAHASSRPWTPGEAGLFGAPPAVPRRGLGGAVARVCRSAPHHIEAAPRTSTPPPPWCVVPPSTRLLCNTTEGSCHISTEVVLRGEKNRRLAHSDTS